jgi:hypothetical protein
MAKIYGQKDNEDVKGAKFSFSLHLADDLYNLNKVSHSGLLIVCKNLSIS